MEFKAEIKIIGINPFILVSKRRAQTLKSGWRKPMPVIVQVNDKPEKPWHINMMPRGDGSFYLYLHGVIRKAANVKVNDRVKVRVEFDDQYRSGPAHPMPVFFQIALSKNKKAKAAWEELSPSRKKEILRYFYSLKSDEARRRNCARAIEVLSGKNDRFMAREWKGGR